MLTSYPACFIKEENGYSVIFPDLGAATCGPTLDNAFAMAIDCLAGLLYTIENNGEEPPAPSPEETVNPIVILKELSDPGKDVSHYETFVRLITVDVAEYAKRHFEQPVRKRVSIPAWLNDAAEKANINFSQVLQDALKERLEIE